MLQITYRRRPFHQSSIDTKELADRKKRSLQLPTPTSFHLMSTGFSWLSRKSLSSERKQLWWTKLQSSLAKNARAKNTRRRRNHLPVIQSTTSSRYLIFWNNNKKESNFLPSFSLPLKIVLPSSPAKWLIWTGLLQHDEMATSCKYESFSHVLAAENCPQ